MNPCRPRAFLCSRILLLLALQLVGPAALPLYSTEPVPSLVDPAATNIVAQYNVRVWQTDGGLPHNGVQAVCQTQDGFIWVGTREGLARFDGVNFFVFTPKNSAGLSGHIVTSLCEGKDGSLWITTEDGGLSRMKNGNFTHYGAADGVSVANMRIVYESSDGAIWVGSLEGLLRYDNGKFSVFTVKEGLLSNIVRYIREDRQGTVWIATDRGLNYWRDGKLGLYRDEESSIVRMVAPDSRGQLWIGTMMGLTVAQGTNIHHFSKEDGLPDNVLGTMCEDHRGNVWVGTSGGLCRFVNNAFFMTEKQGGEAFDQVSAIYEDREGDVWVGAKDGLYCLTPKPFSALTKQQGLSHNNVMSVLEDSSGDIWIATWGGGLNRFSDGKMLNYNASHGFTSEFVLSLHEGRDHSIWIGMDFNDGLYQFKDNQFTHFSVGQGLTDPAVSVIYEDAHANLWLGTRTALIRFRNGKFTRYTTADGLSANQIRAICEDHEGTLWIGTGDGLSRLKENKFSAFTTRDGLSHGNVASIYEDNAHTLWIGTRGGGLNWWRNGKFGSVSLTQGLYDEDIFATLEDGAGYFWIGSMRGVFKVSRRELEQFAAGETKEITSIIYSKNDGLLSAMCNGVAKPGACQSKDGRLLFATTKGVAVAEPRIANTANPQPAPLVIEELFSDGVKIAVENPVPTVPLVISPGRGELEFHYAALSYRAPEKVRYRYKLEGADHDWVDAGPDRVAHYNNILPGNYRFHVIACNKDGVWNQKGASVSFTLSPHLWQTWWFLTAFASISLGSVAGMARYATHKKLQRRLERLEQQHALERERARIAKDMHDDLGSSLTRITLLGELIEADKDNPIQVESQARKIVESARGTVQSLDEIVWAVDPENDTLNGLVDYISHYTNEFFENTEVSCRLEIPVELPEVQLSSEVRHNLFLVIKEALNNALKHANASEIRIQVSGSFPAHGVAGCFLVIEIADNGCGFDSANGTESAGGNGLRNMRERVASIGGKCEIKSTPGQGTLMRLEMKLAG